MDPDHIPESESARSSHHTRRGHVSHILIPILTAIVIVVALLYFAPVIMGMITSDIGPVDDRDLIPGTVEVPQEQNAYGLIPALDRAVVLTPVYRDVLERMVKGEERADDAATLNALISENTQTLLVLRAMDERTAFIDPILEDPSTLTPEVIPTSLGKLHGAYRIALASGEWRARRGDFVGAVDDTLLPARLAHKLTEPNCSLINYLVASVMRRESLEALQRLLGQYGANMTAQELQQLRSALAQLGDDTRGLRTALQIEYLSLRVALHSLTSGTTDDSIFPAELVQDVRELGTDSYQFRPNETTLLFRDLWRRKSTDALGSCATPAVATAPREQITTPAWMLYITENAVGKVLYSVAATSVGDLHTRRCTYTALLNAVTIQAALVEYHNKVDSYPTSLQDLVPGYLSTLPDDPYSGQAFRYKADERILCSVGDDLVAGNCSYGDEKSNDLIFKL